LTFSIQNIIQHLNAKTSGSFSDFIVENVSIDSRSLQNSSGTLFFALKGTNHNGHDYIESLIAKGVLNFVVEFVPNKLVGKANFIIIDDTKKALMRTTILLCPRKKRK
jgi:alanine racemase